MSKAFYITTTLPYVNAEPHVGFATEILRADAIARYQKLMGSDVFFNTGTDEHGQKVYDKAMEVGEDPQKYADRFAIEFQKLIPTLGITEDIHFIRTTNQLHKKAAQEMWQRCDASGDIYKAIQKIKYCIGCELEKTDSELVDGKCPLHSHKEIEIREEENYFFRFSKYQKPLLELYKSRPDFILPSFRQQEIKMFVEAGLRDFSVSRLKSKMPWGVAVPNDDEHVMFVWFDALTNYISTLGWPEDKDGKFKKFWEKGETFQVAGKDNLRQQSAIWQAMLMSAGLPNTKQVIIGGFINSGGQKMSKSLGNVISPFDMVKRYGTDATRYILLRHVHSTEDTDITWERMDEWYTANLVNGLGNFIARVMKMAEDYEIENGIPIGEDELLGLGLSLKSHTTEMEKLTRYFGEFKFNQGMDVIWETIVYGDGIIQKEEPFKLIKTDREKAKKVVANLSQRAFRIGVMLEPFMPETAKIIQEAVISNKKPANLFNRLEE